MKNPLSRITLTFAIPVFFLSSGVSTFAQDKEVGSKPPAEAKQADESTDAEKSPTPRLIPSLIAVLSPTEGSETRGVVTFEPVEDEEVRVTARVSGLKPDSKHAIHIHEFGDISSPDGTSAGGHFNPAGKAHGLPDSEDRHVGDFGNLEADAEGNANHVLTLKNISLVGDASAIIGRAVVVHALEDKGTQPSGDAGDRIAHGVIAIANPDSIKTKVAKNEQDENDPAAASVTSATTPGARAATPPSPGEKVERAAEKVGRGAEKAARNTAKAVERGAKEVGDALKKVGEKLEEAAE